MTSAGLGVEHTEQKLSTKKNSLTLFRPGLPLLHKLKPLQPLLRLVEHGDERSTLGLAHRRELRRPLQVCRLAQHARTPEEELAHRLCG